MPSCLGLHNIYCCSSDPLCVCVLDASLPCLLCVVCWEYFQGRVNRNHLSDTLEWTPSNDILLERTFLKTHTTYSQWEHCYHCSKALSEGQAGGYSHTHTHTLLCNQLLGCVS